MLPKARRIYLKRDFEHIFKQGGSLQGKLFRFKFLKNNLKHSRFAVVVSSKVSKKAVVRNRIRRRAWSVISDFDQNFNNKIDLVLVALADSVKADFNGIKNEISFFITKKLS